MSKKQKYDTSASAWENNEEIKIFQEYLQIPSVHPDINYGKFYYMKCINISII